MNVLAGGHHGGDKDQDGCSDITVAAGTRIALPNIGVVATLGDDSIFSLEGWVRGRKWPGVAACGDSSGEDEVWKKDGGPISAAQMRRLAGLK